MVPFDRLIINPTQFYPENCPIPPSNLPPMLQALLGKAAAALLNTAMSKATQGSTPARLLTINTLVENNCQNQVYAMYVDLTLRQAVALAITNNNPLNVELYLNNAAENMWLLLASVLVANNQYAHPYMQAHEIQASYKNNADAPAIQAKLMGLNLNMYMQNQQAPMYQNYQPQFQNTTGPMTTVPLNTTPGHSSLGSQWGAPVPQQQQFFASEETRQFNGTFTGQPTTPQLPMPEQIVPVATPVPTAPVIAPSATGAFNVLTCNGATEMDMNVHAIPYFGTGVAIDLSGRRADLKSDALALNRAARDPNPAGPVLLNKNLRYEISTDSAIVVASAVLSKNRTESYAPTVYRFFTTILHSRVCAPGVEKVMELFQHCNSLSELVVSMRNGYSQLFKDPSNPTIAEQSFLNATAFIDRRLTVMVNDFLAHNLRLSIRISSFATDYPDLAPEIRKRAQEAGVAAFDAWSTRVRDMLRDTDHDKAIECISREFEEDMGGYVYVPSTESVTLLSLTFKELGYTMKDDTAYRIDERTTPVLYDLVDSLARNKKDLGIYTVKDRLVTADDVRFTLAPCAVESGVWYAFKN